MNQNAKKGLCFDKQLLFFCVICVAIWVLVAHGYVFTNFQPTHDSLDGLHAVYPNNDNAHKIGLGRVFCPVYYYLFRSAFSTPYLSGINTILWIGLAAFFVISSFNLKGVIHKVLVCGVMAVNLTVTALAATFIHDLDADMCAMALACLAVFVWQKKMKGWPLLGSIAVAGSLGLYQSYVSTTITLVMMILIKELMDNKSVKAVLQKGVQAALMVLAGGIMYYVSMHIVLSYTQYTLFEGTYNSLSQMSTLSLSVLPELFMQQYAAWWKWFANPKTVLVSSKIVAAANIVLLLIGAVVLVFVVCRKELRIAQKGFLLFMVLLLPVAMNITFILSQGTAHDLTRYTYIFLYVLLIVFIEYGSEQISGHKWTGPARYICIGMIGIFLWGGVQTANTIYLQKTMVHMSTYTHMTNVLHDMQQEGFSAKDTPILTVGELPIEYMAGFERVERITGVSYSNSITKDTRSFKSYFRYILGEPIEYCSEEQRAAVVQDPSYAEMPAYPEEGYIQMIQDVMVIRLN